MGSEAESLWSCREAGGGQKSAGGHMEGCGKGLAPQRWVGELLQGVVSVSLVPEVKIVPGHH